MGLERVLAKEGFVREDCDFILFQEGLTVCRTFPRLEPTEPVNVRRHGAVETEGKERRARSKNTKNGAR